MNTKKVFTGLVMFLLTALFHTSCSKEEMTGNSEENNTVRISASLPEDFAETRTAGEIPVKDEHYLRCILEVWDESYTSLLQRHEKLVGNSSDLNFEFKVIEQGTYQCLLWADFITNNTPAEGNATSPPPKEAIQEAVSPPASHSKEEPERRRRNSKPEKLDYDTVFICGSNITARLGKQVYIRKEYHDRIQKMLHVIGGNEVTIAAFLDNVLTHHFTLFQDEIAESFKRHMESYNL